MSKIKNGSILPESQGELSQDDQLSLVIKSVERLEVGKVNDHIKGLRNKIELEGWRGSQEILSNLAKKLAYITSSPNLPTEREDREKIIKIWEICFYKDSPLLTWQGEDNMTLWHLGVDATFDKSFVIPLIKNVGYDPNNKLINAKNSLGLTPMSYFILGGRNYAEGIDYERNIGPGQNDEYEGDFRIALSRAALSPYSHAETYRALLEAGADPSSLSLPKTCKGVPWGPIGFVPKTFLEWIQNVPMGKGNNYYINVQKNNLIELDNGFIKEILRDHNPYRTKEGSERDLYSAMEHQLQGPSKPQIEEVASFWLPPVLCNIISDYAFSMLIEGVEHSGFSGEIYTYFETQHDLI